MRIMHYTGHMISPPGVEGRFPASSEAAVTLSIRNAIAEIQPKMGFGSLAGGADTIIVEEMLQFGAEAQVILPFPPERFIETSVSRCGPSWVERFQYLLKRVASTTILPSDASPDEDGFYRLTTERAMQASRTAAERMGLEAIQLAVWDGKIGQTPAGTWHDIKVWRESGRKTICLNAVTGLRVD